MSLSQLVFVTECLTGRLGVVDIQLLQTQRPAHTVHTPLTRTKAYITLYYMTLLFR